MKANLKADVLVETGAADVSISQGPADRLGISSHLAARYRTANGKAVGYMARLASVKLGGIESTELSRRLLRVSTEMSRSCMSFLNRMSLYGHQ